MTRRGRIFGALAVAAMTAWGVSLAPLRPRATLSNVILAEITRLWFSPDSQSMVTFDFSPSHGDRLRLWRVGDGRAVATLDDGGNWMSVAFAADGAELAALKGPTDEWGIGEFNTITTWFTSTGQKKRAREFPHRFKDFSIVYDSQGNLLLTNEESGAMTWRSAANDDVVAVKKLPEDRALRSFPGEARPCMARLSMDSVQRDKILRFLERPTGRVLELPAAMFDSCQFDISSDDRALALCPWEGRGECRVLLTASGAVTHLASLDGCSKPTISPDGTFLAARIDRPKRQDLPWFSRFVKPVDTEIRAARVSTGEIIGQYSHGIDSMFSPDGRTLAVLTNHATVELWDFPPRRAWGCTFGGAMVVGGCIYALLAWRTHRRTRVVTYKS